MSESPPDKESLTPNVAAASESTVTVIVEGAKSATGTIYVAVCDKGLSQEGCPYKGKVAAAPGRVKARLRGIPPGRYAVVGFQDKNDNGEFDKLLGLPREPYALSGKAGEQLVPRFQDALVTVSNGDNDVIIALKNIGR
jgi:uncharacterized protein (DUF2141 family)